MSLRKIFACAMLALASATAFPQQNYSSSTHVFKTVDQHEILLDVFRPTGDEVRPAIMWIHGGALILGTREWLLPWQREMYIDAGFVVVTIDYRLAPETKLPDILSDIDGAYAWLRTEGPKRFRIDPDRIASK